ncbi:MAG: hypothetical protein AB7M05_07170 [Alphaproteobacteria bacterium]
MFKVAGLLVAASAWFAADSAHAAATADDILSLTSKDPANLIFVAPYLTGIVEGLDQMQDIYKTKGQPPVYCTSLHNLPESPVPLLVRFVEANPDKGKLSPGAVTMLALAWAYPCKE